MTDITPTALTREIVVEDFFPHSAEIIWKTLTTGALIGRWLMEPAGFEAVVGKDFTFQTRPAGQWDGTIRCKVLEVAPHHKLVYSWKSGHETNVGYGATLDTIVTWTLIPKDNGTIIRLVHSGFVTPRNDSAIQAMGDGWRKVVPNIVQIAGESIH